MKCICLFLKSQSHKRQEMFFLIFNLKFSKKTALAFKKCRPDTRLLPVCAKRRTHCSTTERDFKIKLRIIQIGSLVWAALRATNPHFREAMRETMREGTKSTRCLAGRMLAGTSAFTSSCYRRYQRIQRDRRVAGCWLVFHQLCWRNGIVQKMELGWYSGTRQSAPTSCPLTNAPFNSY